MYRRRLTAAERQERQQESLNRAQQGIALSNYPAIFAGFEAKGIPADEIRPRENVFTFNAWKALGRYVRKGEHGVAVVTWIHAEGKRDGTTGEVTEPGHSFARRVYVFHVSQTEPAAR